MALKGHEVTVFDEHEMLGGMMRYGIPGFRTPRHVLHLTRAAEAMRGVAGSYASALKSEQLAPAERYQAFFAVLARDAADSVAAVELVLAQRAISSQLIDNLNASIHLRALLTDLFLLADILETQQAQAAALASAQTTAS